MTDIYKLCRFWSYHRRCFLTYDEWIKESWDDEELNRSAR